MNSSDVFDLLMGIALIILAIQMRTHDHAQASEPTATGLQAHSVDEAGCLHYVATGVSDYWRNYEVIICPDGARTVEIAE